MTSKVFLLARVTDESICTEASRSTSRVVGRPESLLRKMSAAALLPVVLLTGTSAPLLCATPCALRARATRSSSLRSILADLELDGEAVRAAQTHLEGEQS